MLESRKEYHECRTESKAVPVEKPGRNPCWELENRVISGKRGSYECDAQEVCYDEKEGKWAGSSREMREKML